VVDVKDERETWQEFFLRLANLWATRSRDPSTKCGTVIVNADNIVVSAGYNGLPRRVLDSANRLEDRETKLDWTVHSEANAIVNAARIGSAVQGCDLYTTPLLPCIDCTPLIINAGIARIITNGLVWDDPDNDHSIVKAQLVEACVPIIQL
jgi:dCMP deaminase